jgi:hypothetical protein
MQAKKNQDSHELVCLGKEKGFFMAGSHQSLKAGLTKDEVIARLGEPDRREFVKESFRPPDQGEAKNDYQIALRQWEHDTAGEVWSYDARNLTVRISKTGSVLDWSDAQTTSPSSTPAGPVKIEPEAK